MKKNLDFFIYIEILIIKYLKTLKLNYQDFYFIYFLYNNNVLIILKSFFQ